jgi:hypothetical protein
MAASKFGVVSAWFLSFMFVVLDVRGASSLSPIPQLDRQLLSERAPLAFQTLVKRFQSVPQEAQGVPPANLLTQETRLWIEGGHCAGDALTQFSTLSRKSRIASAPANPEGGGHAGLSSRCTPQPTHEVGDARRDHAPQKRREGAGRAGTLPGWRVGVDGNYGGKDGFLVGVVDVIVVKVVASCQPGRPTADPGQVAQEPRLRCRVLVPVVLTQVDEDFVRQFSQRRVGSAQVGHGGDAVSPRVGQFPR